MSTPSEATTARVIIGQLGELATPMIPYRRGFDRAGDDCESFYEVWRRALTLAESLGGKWTSYFGGVRCVLPDSSCIFSTGPTWEWEVEGGKMWEPAAANEGAGV